MSKKLFVGGLSWGTDDQSLRAAFEQFGVLRKEPPSFRRGLFAFVPRCELHTDPRAPRQRLA